MAGCVHSPTSSSSILEPSSSSLEQSSSPAGLETSEAAEPEVSSETEYRVGVPKENREQLKKMREEVNSGIVCWLQVPNTEINKPIVQSADNNAYSHRGVDKQFLFEGTLRMDYECDLKGGTKAGVPQNTISATAHVDINPNPKQPDFSAED